MIVYSKSLEAFIYERSSIPPIIFQKACTLLRTIGIMDLSFCNKKLNVVNEAHPVVLEDTISNLSETTSIYSINLKFLLAVYFVTVANKSIRK